MNDVLAKLAPRDLEVLGERVQSDEFDGVVAGFMLRRALGLATREDRKMHRNATFEDPESALSGSQIIALQALLAGETRTKAADLAGVDRATLYRWLGGDPSFVAALANRKAEIVGSAVARLRALAADAVGVLAELLKQSSGPHLRHRVASQILELAGIDCETNDSTRDMTTARELQIEWDEDAADRTIFDMEQASDRKLRRALAEFGSGRKDESGD